MNANQVMSRPVTTIGPHDTVEKAASLMLESNSSCLPVLDKHGKLIGILTHTDFGFHRKFFPMADHLYTLMGSWVTPKTLEDVAKEVSKKTVSEVMSHPVVTVQEDATISDVAETMVRNKIHRIPVLKGEEVVGMITRHDFVKLMASDTKGN